MDQLTHPTVRRGRPWRALFVALLGLAAVGAVAAAALVLALLPSLPPVQQLAEAELKVPLRVYTAEGELIAEFGEERRIMVQIDEVPPRLIQAIISAEDHNFYRHYGVDVPGILRAAWYNLRAGGNVQGASTITMQVARNFFLSPEKTYTRKLKELLLALKIERELTKGQILELYINKIFLGHRAYGFAAAAQVYYGAPLTELTLAQLAMLAGLPKAPSRDNPLSNPDNARERRNYVLAHMHDLGYIDQAEYQAAREAPLTASRHSINYALEAPYVAEMVRQHMVQTYDEKAYAGGFHVYTTIRAEHQRAANRALRAALLEYDRRHGYRGPAAHVQLEQAAELELDRLDDVLKDYRVVGELLPGVVTQVAERGAAVYTLDGTTVELDWDALSWARPYLDDSTVGDEPQTAGDVVRRGDIVYLEPLGQAEGAMRWRLAQVPEVSGALVSLRPRDGAILALIGGFDFQQSSFNRATQAERQPGSGLKPFIYTAALAKGFTPATTISGAPIVIEDANLEDEWRPQNYSERFFGPTRLRKALALSLNLVSVRLLRAIGPAYAAEYLTRFGFAADKLPRNLSLALGNAAATPLQMARAFAVFANGGFRVEPYFIARIEDAAHTVLEQAEPLIACADCPVPAADAAPGADAAGTALVADTGAAAAEPAVRVAPRALSPELAFIMTTMLRDVVSEGTARRAMALGRNDLAGKTGTTDEYRDAWFNGFNSEIAATAWVGFDQVASLGQGEAGSRAALPMWIDYMRTALAGVPEQPLEPPAGVVQAYIDSDTGNPLPGPGPNAIAEWFVAGTEGITPIVTPAADANGVSETPAAVAAPAAPEPARPPPTQKIRERLF